MTWVDRNRGLPEGYVPPSTSTQPWLSCPNDPKCPHPGLLHGYRDPDGARFCSIEGCTCGWED